VEQAMAKWTREAIIEAVKQAVAGADGPLSRPACCRRAGVPERQLFVLFHGGWTEVRQLAGIARHPGERVSMTDEQLLQEFHRVACSIGALPSWARFTALAPVGSHTLQRRFGGRPGTLRRYRQWLEKNHPECPLLQLLPSEGKPDRQRASPPKVLRSPPRWNKQAGMVFGAPIHFRGLQYAPTKEQGVIVLFGMVLSELDLLVEAIQPAYPDCQAMRRIDPRHNRWQPVRIEFEFTSSKFRDHGHDPSGCDLIVCWEHDWPDCPLEVIELSAVIGKLKG
jgi:hypothetical protein